MSIDANKKLIIAATAIAVAFSSASCSTASKVFAVQKSSGYRGPITNPFIDYQMGSQKAENIVLRTKKGDRSVEIELPDSRGSMNDFVLPLSPAFRAEGGRNPASAGMGAPDFDPESDKSYKDVKPSITDREITSQFPTVTPGQEGDQRDVEMGLGVVPTDEEIPAADSSYLAALDHVKQLYKYGRNETALLEIDQLLRAYPTDPKLYQMRGTLLDRVGRDDLALKSWNQALRLDPSNQSLRKFIERKQSTRDIASH